MKKKTKALHGHRINPISSRTLSAIALMVGVVGCAHVCNAKASAGLAVTHTASATADRLAKADRQYGNLPLRFEENRGQTDAAVKYLSRGSSSTLFLTPKEAVLSLSRRAPAQAKRIAAEKPAAAPLEKSVLRMQFKGSKGASEVVGEDMLNDKTNYFVGKDPSEWTTGVRNFSKVHYRDVYPGIDVVYYGHDQQLEYDFLVAPKADVSAVRLAFDGAKKMSVDHEGNLVLHTTLGDVVQKKPVAYQMIDGERRIVEARYVRRGRNEIGIALADFDRNLAVVVDPVLMYSTYLGGSQSEVAVGVAIDREECAYVTGGTGSIDFPAVGSPISTPAASDMVFVSKINPTGTNLMYSVVLGGTGAVGEYPVGIAVDSYGNAYLAGDTSSDDFPVTPGAFQVTYNGYVSPNYSYHAFVTKIDPQGDNLVYSTYLGGTGSFDQAFGMTIDSQGYAYVTGYTDATDFPTEQAYTTTGSGFLTKLNPDGGRVTYSTYLGGQGVTVGYGIAVDAKGVATAVGGTQSDDWPGMLPSGISHEGSIDAFVATFDGEGTPTFFSFLGGQDVDWATAVAVDESSIYLAGTTRSSKFKTKDAMQPSYGGGFEDAFAARFSGGALDYSTFLGGAQGDWANAIATDGLGNIYIGGTTDSSDFPQKNGLNTFYHGNWDGYLTVLNGAGQLKYGSFVGDDGMDQVHGLGISAGGNVYVVGETSSSNIAKGPVIQPNLNGPQDGYLMRFDGPFIP